MAYVAGTDPLIIKLCDILGIPANKTRELTIHVGVDRLMMVTTTQYVSKDELEEIIDSFEPYELVEITRKVIKKTEG